MGVRLGPNSSGEGSNVAQSEHCTPPALLKTSVREIPALLSAPGQVSFPPPIDSGASLGFSGMRDRSFEVAFGSRDAYGFSLVRFAKATSRAYEATKQDLARGANVGYCPNCARAARVAVPPMYSLVEYNALGPQGLAPWRRFGPWAPRRLAALHYAKALGPLSSAWDSAATSRFLLAPGLLMRAPPSGIDVSAHAFASKPPPAL